jgi:hypothetical protein
VFANPRSGVYAVLCLASVVLASTSASAGRPLAKEEWAGSGGSAGPFAHAADAEGAPDPLANLEASRTLPTPAFRCTQVIGYSQVLQWFRQSMAFESAAGTGRWQLLWRLGGGVDHWRDPDYEGWHVPVVSPCAQGSDSPDRVLLSVSGSYGSDVSAWEEAIQATIANIRHRYASVRQIILQPVVGGPQHETCRVGRSPVRASWQQEYIDQAISRIVGGQVVRGLSPVVQTCGDYRDRVGHLTDAGAAAVGRAIGAYYRSRDP